MTHYLPFSKSLNQFYVKRVKQPYERQAKDALQGKGITAQPYTRVLRSMNPKTDQLRYIDRVDWERGILYEIKSDAPGQAEQGLIELEQLYKPLMERAFPTKKWTVEVLIYDLEIAKTLYPL